MHEHIKASASVLSTKELFVLASCMYSIVVWIVSCSVGAVTNEFSSHIKELSGYARLIRSIMKLT